MNHPYLLAFDVGIQPLEDYEDLEWRTVTARDLADLGRLLSPSLSYCLLAVHHISDEDSFTLTDLIWRMSQSLVPYSDSLATESFARQS